MCRAHQQTQATQGGQPAGSTAKQKQFNMCTYKIHCILDYLAAIRHYGTMDLYNMPVVCNSLIVRYVADLLAIEQAYALSVQDLV